MELPPQFMNLVVSLNPAKVMGLVPKAVHSFQDLIKSVNSTESVADEEAAERRKSKARVNPLLRFKHRKSYRPDVGQNLDVEV